MPSLPGVAGTGESVGISLSRIAVEMLTSAASIAGMNYLQRCTGQQRLVDMLTFMSNYKMMYFNTA